MLRRLYIAAALVSSTVGTLGFPTKSFATQPSATLASNNSPDFFSEMHAALTAPVTGWSLVVLGVASAIALVVRFRK